MTDAQRERWEAVLATLVTALPPQATGVVIDGEHAACVADRLARALRSAGRPCVRLSDRAQETDVGGVMVADGPRWRDHPPAGQWSLAIRLRSGGGRQGTGSAQPRPQPQPHPGPRPPAAAYAVLDLGDPGWPVIKHITGDTTAPPHWYVAENQAFFAVRAANWDTKFGDDIPAYSAAVDEAAPPAGGVALDLGCGTGRALPALREAVGQAGLVVGVDVTPQMLDAVRSSGRDREATALLLGDAQRLPFADARIDLIFAAGLLNHLDDPPFGLRELARVTKPGGRLVVFHPTGRAALAARHGRVLGPDEPLAEHVLGSALAGSGWKLERYEDPPHRFFALAERV